MSCRKITLQVWRFLVTSVDTVVWSTLLGFVLLLIVNVKHCLKNSTNSTVLLYECSQNLGISSCFSLPGELTRTHTVLPVSSCRFASTHTLKHSQKPAKFFTFDLISTTNSACEDRGNRQFLVDFNNCLCILCGHVKIVAIVAVSLVRYEVGIDMLAESN